MTDQEAWQEAYARYDGDRRISDDTGEEELFDDWGYAECERRAFLTGVEWAKSRNRPEPEWSYEYKYSTRERRRVYAPEPWKAY